MGTERQGLMKFAFRLLASRADAEDAVQDTYLRALAAFPDSVAPQPAWLYTVLRNIAIDRLRRKQLETEHAMAELASDPLPQIPIEIQSECKAALRHLLRRVSSAEAAAILLRDVFEFGYEDLARIIDKSEAAARQFLHRARTRAWCTEWGTDVDEVTIALYWHAIEARDPGPSLRRRRPLGRRYGGAAREVPRSWSRSTAGMRLH
jgi:RNA polymerase sigma-70 factor (ECF subfamily)